MTAEMTGNNLIRTNNETQETTTPPAQLVDNNELVLLIKQLYSENLDLASKVGETKLLTDSEHRTREEYFKVVQERAELKARLELQQQRILDLQEKLRLQDDAMAKSWLRKL